MAKTIYCDALLQQHLYGASVWTPPVNIYIALSTTAPTPTGGNVTEPSTADGYGRVAVANNGTNFGPVAVEPSSGYTIANLVAIAFNADVTATWGTPTYWVAYDGPVGGQRSVTDGATNATTTVTSATANFTTQDIGRTLTGGSIPAGATITAINSATSVTISAPATASATGLSLTLGSMALDIGTITSPQPINPGTTPSFAPQALTSTNN